jgi:hypothetical protein
MEQCKKVTKDQIQDFKLTTKIFMCYPKFWLNHLMDFTLNINNHPISINFSLFSCFCGKLQELDHEEKQLALSVSNEDLDCFLSFFDLMKGYSFDFTIFNSQSLKSLIHCLKMDYLFQFIFSRLPIPHTLEESLQFISQTYHSFCENRFQLSLSIIAENFKLISFDALNKLPNLYLMKIFASESLQVESEDYLFQLVAKMIKRDRNRMVLLKTIKFDYVSSHLFKDFFDDICQNEFNLELLEILKKKLVADYSDQINLSKRWSTKPKILHRIETIELFQMLNSYFGEEQNPISQVKVLIEQIQQQKLEIEFLQKKNIPNYDQIKQMKSDNESLQLIITRLKIESDEKSQEIQQLQNKNELLRNHNFQLQHPSMIIISHGLLHHFKENDRSKIYIECSSVNHSSQQPKNLLIDDRDTKFLSKNEQNSWFCVSVDSQKIILSGYFLRSYKNYPCTPKNWKLEGSYDKENWKLIDRQVQINWKTQEWSEVYFPVQSAESFSYFKFTQTGKNYNGNHHLLLSYFEIFGTICDQ